MPGESGVVEQGCHSLMVSVSYPGKGANVLGAACCHTGPPGGHAGSEQAGGRSGR